MKSRVFAVLAGSALVLCAAGSKADVGIGINPRVGTLGYGAELSVRVSDKLSLGLGFNSASRNTQSNTEGVDYDFDSKLRSTELLLNYRPMAGAFRLRAGVLLNRNEFAMTGKPDASGNFEFNGTTYPAAAVGSLNGKLSFKKNAPYLGLGWGNRPNGSWGVTFDLGAVYQGKPKLSLEATPGTLPFPPGFAADLEAERQQAEEDLSSFKWYPVAQLGLYFRF